MTQDGAAPPSVLFVCVSNAGKSQMAEALMRQIAGDAVEVHSAGTSPKTEVNALSAQVVTESGADMRQATPKGIDPELLARADRVIILGDDAKVNAAPGMRASIERWSTDEPSERGIEGVERMRLVRDDIANRVAALALELTGQPAGNLGRYQKLIEDLADRYEGVFTEPEVRSAVREAHSGLLPGCTVAQFLPVLVGRYAGEILSARAQAEGKEHQPFPQLLFVCVQNAGRSQIAAAMAKHLSGGKVNVRSAGSNPTGEVNPMAVQVLTERRIPMPDAYPKPLGDDVIRASDVVITMGCGDICPVLPGKRYEDWPVADPDGADIQTVRKIADDIQMRVTRLLGELRRN
ncbi:three-helix bundle dimerization domain-containing protein [Blastococcus sp. Marseille-P5729]|uniref:arsenate reductase/protein-tyrosine-phosphatase family protein n=1 Tax=Blastococcus sp. Marseille-P5729 TaxID=2086582 RepID=UPI001F2D1CAE|nr:hypothetical protein [Blastococcus sp. Marseille-P5729]